MPALAPPVADERNALREFLAFHQSAYFAVSYGLTDEQARSAPAVSALSIGGLVKHATEMQRTWMARVAAAPDLPPNRSICSLPDSRPARRAIRPRLSCDRSSRMPRCWRKRWPGKGTGSFPAAPTRT